MRYGHEFDPLVTPEANARACRHCGEWKQNGRPIELAEQVFCPAHQARHDAFVAAAITGSLPAGATEMKGEFEFMTPAERACWVVQIADAIMAELAK